MNIVVIMPDMQYAKQLPMCAAYKMEIRGHPQFHWSLLSLSDVMADRYIFVVHYSDDATSFIADQCSELGITEYKIVEYDFHVSGQAECVMIASPYIRADQSLLVWNIGMTAEPGGITSEQFCGDGYILSPVSAEQRGSCNHSSDAVLLQNYPLQARGDTGGFYFRTASLYEQLYYDYYIPDNENADKNIGPLYDKLIRQGGTVYLADVPAALTGFRSSRVFHSKGKAMRTLHLLLKGE